MKRRIEGVRTGRIRLLNGPACLLALLLAASFPCLAAADETAEPEPQAAEEEPQSTEAPEPQAAPTAVGVNEDPQTELMTVVEPRLEVDATGTSPLDGSYDPATGSITFSATDISLPGNFDIPVELGRWVPTDDYDTGGPGGGWTWNLPFIRGNSWT